MFRTVRIWWRRARLILNKTLHNFSLNDPRFFFCDFSFFQTAFWGLSFPRVLSHEFSNDLVALLLISKSTAASVNFNVKIFLYLTKTHTPRNRQDCDRYFSNPLQPRRVATMSWQLAMFTTWGIFAIRCACRQRIAVLSKLYNGFWRKILNFTLSFHCNNRLSGSL